MIDDIAEQNEVLVERLLAGDTTAQNELIEINRPLVFTTVRRFLDNWPSFKYLHADMIGVGMVALIQATNRLIEIGEANRPIRNFLITFIRGYLLNELLKEAEHAKDVGSYSEIPEHILAVHDSTFDRIDDRDFLMSLCESDRDRKILTFFLEGENQVDISRETEFTENIVRKTLGQIRENLRNVRDLVSGWRPKKQST